MPGVIRPILSISELWVSFSVTISVMVAIFRDAGMVSTAARRQQGNRHTINSDKWILCILKYSLLALQLCRNKMKV